MLAPAAGFHRLRATVKASMSTAHASHGEHYKHGMASLGGVSTAEALRRLGDGSTVQVVQPMPTSTFVTPQSVNYSLDGKPRRWDMVQSHPSVACLLYHRDRKAFLLVRQFRPAVYVSAAKEAAAEGTGQLPLPLACGFTYELCAGIIDKPHLDLKGIMSEEIAEECGFDVPPASIHKITSFISAIGISGARQHVYAAEVDDGMVHATAGGGLADHGECIEVLALPEESVESFLLDESLAKSAGALFALSWGREQLRRHGGRLFPPGP